MCFGTETCSPRRTGYRNYFGHTLGIVRKQRSMANSQWLETRSSTLDSVVSKQRKRYLANCIKSIASCMKKSWLRVGAWLSARPCWLDIHCSNIHSDWVASFGCRCSQGSHIANHSYSVPRSCMTAALGIADLRNTAGWPIVVDWRNTMRSLDCEFETGCRHRDRWKQQCAGQPSNHTKWSGMHLS